jgi:membrane protease YdiL (CAAX protease family)
MNTLKSFIKRHAVPIYFILTFALSWGCMAMIISPNRFPMTAEQSEMAGPFIYVALLVGPSVAGILLTGLVSGKAGYRELLSRLSRWRVGVRWYAVVLLATPLLATVVLLVLSLFSPEFIPVIFTSDDKSTLLLTGVGVGLMVGIFEELGWTGFVVPRMRLRYGIPTTGIIVGLLWGAWHFLAFWETNSFSGALPLAIMLMRLFSWLPPFRTLMVWVHDRTESLLMVMLMHASLVLSTLVLPSMELSGGTLLIWLLAWAAALWGAVLVVANNRSTILKE